MLKLLKTYKKRLTNLTSRNRSLFLLNLKSRHFIDLHSFDFINKKASFSILETLISTKKSIVLCPQLDPRDGQSNIFSKQLKGIWKTDSMLRAESGSEDLFVGYPFVEGKLMDKTLIRCPLLFFPVQFVQKQNQWVLEKKELPVSFNRSFLTAYSQFNQVKIDENSFEKSPADFGHEPKVFLTKLYEFLKNSPLEINFNAELFVEKLIAFQSLIKVDFETVEVGELKLKSQAVLGIFPQTGSFIADDYDELINSGFDKKYNSLEDFIIDNKPRTLIIKEQDLHLPLPVDASQEEAIRQIKSGKSILIQGPPGTGKSQLICNLMADYAAEGKRVLLVCQKRAALDTVYQRIAEIGMDRFTALVHDFQSDRKILYSKISSQIDNISAFKHANQSLNAIFLEREFDSTCRKIDQLTEKLELFKIALYDTQRYGKSIKELYLDANHQTEKELDLQSVFSFFHYDTLDIFLQNLKTFERYQKTFQTDDLSYSFWQNRKSFKHLNHYHYDELRNIITHITKIKNELRAINEPFTLEDNLEILFCQNYLNTYKNNSSFTYIQKAFNKISNKENVKKRLIEVSELKSEVVQNELVPLNFLNESLKLVSNYIEKTSNFPKKIFWLTFSREKKKVYQLYLYFSLNRAIHGISDLRDRIHKHIRLQEIASEIDLHTNNSTIGELLAELENQLRGHLFIEQLSTFTPSKMDFENKSNFDEKIGRWLKLLSAINASKEKWITFFSKKQIHEISSEKEQSIKKYLEIHFDNLYAYDKLFGELTAAEKECYLQCKNTFDDNYAKHFETNLILHFIDDLENKEPLLRSVSSLEMQIWEEELQALIKKKEKFSTEYLLLRLREKTFKNIEKNRLGNSITYRELLHQTTKKKQLWPIRKLFSDFSNELFDLVPCWLASPETVSALFPIFNEEKFDLVIFDEASQCFAEKAIPAMFRAKQIVIAGDSKQLQPNDLYRVKVEEETDDAMLLEIESLLELGQNFMPETILRGHYRSKSLDLIDFSNKHFYDNKLKLLPNYEEINAGIPAIDFIKVDGIWDKNQNIIEAKRILELTKNIATIKKIGVVTFNAQQADLIQDLTYHLSNVMVKNIENIQGDEFDLVIFSIAYAPNEKGQIKMNFGSLNQKGGENRLNVAITRAREKIIIVSSILPEDLIVEKSINEGPKLLKAYLNYAQNVAKGAFIPCKLKSSEHDMATLLKDEIIKSNSNFSDILPFADLVQRKNNLFENLVLTDDQQFYNAESIKESFAYLPMMLSKKGWTYHKAWSRNWWLKPKSELSLLEEKEVIE
jgi:superfamily I DNA and/or RNA helicase